MSSGIEKSGKILENCEADLEHLGFRYTVDYFSICSLLCLYFMSREELSFFKISSPICYLEIYNEVILHRLPTPFAV